MCIITHNVKHVLLASIKKKREPGTEATCSTRLALLHAVHVSITIIICSTELTYNNQTEVRCIYIGGYTLIKTIWSCSIYKVHIRPTHPHTVVKPTHIHSHEYYLSHLSRPIQSHHCCIHVIAKLTSM